MKNLILSGILLCILAACNNGPGNKTSPINSTELGSDSQNIWEEIDKKTAWFKKGSKVYYSLDSIDSGFMEL